MTLNVFSSVLEADFAVGYPHDFFITETMNRIVVAAPDLADAYQALSVIGGHVGVDRSLNHTFADHKVPLVKMMARGFEHEPAPDQHAKQEVLVRKLERDLPGFTLHSIVMRLTAVNPATRAFHLDAAWLLKWLRIDLTEGERRRVVYFNPGPNVDFTTVSHQPILSAIYSAF